MTFRTKSTYVEVEIDLDDFDTKVLQDELRSRQKDIPGDTGDLIQKLWIEFYMGREDRALDVAREIAELFTGRLVPFATRRAA